MNGITDPKQMATCSAPEEIAEVVYETGLHLAAPLTQAIIMMVRPGQLVILKMVRSLD